MYLTVESKRLQQMFFNTSKKNKFSLITIKIMVKIVKYNHNICVYTLYWL